MKIGMYAREYKLLLVTSFIWFMVQFLRMVFPPLFESIQTQYGVSNSETGLMFTLLLLGYALVQFPAGTFSDYYGETRIIIAGIIIFSVAALLTSISFTFALLLGCATLIGIGTGVHKTVSINLLSDAYPKRTGRALGTMDTVGMFGGVAGGAVVVAFLILSLPWQGIFFASGLVSIGLAFGFHRVTRSDLDEEKPENALEDDGLGAADRRTLDSYAKAFLNFDILLFVVIASLFTFTWNGISAFLPLFLINEKGFSASASGIMFSGFFIVSVSQIVTGELSDRLGRLVVILGIIGLTLASLVLLLAFSSKWLVVLVVLLMGAAFHGIRPARDSHLINIIPDSLGGGVLGIVRTAMTGIGAIAPATIGFMADQVGLSTTFTGVAMILLLCGLLTVVLMAKTSAV